MVRPKDKMFTRQTGHVLKYQQNKSILWLVVTLLFSTKSTISYQDGLLHVKGILVNLAMFYKPD